MKIGFIANAERDGGLELTGKLMEFVRENGCAPVLFESEGDDGRLEECGFLVVLGGDGTLLRAAVKTVVMEKSLPLLGINLGNLGYLTGVERIDAESALLKAMQGHYSLETRMMLELSVGDKVFHALNETCFKNSALSKISDVSIEVNGEYIDTYRCDGVIVCTPTGSTAYNLSAGGPILKPDGKMIAVTPICPHTLYARPFVVSSDDVITIRAVSDLLVIMDGRGICEIEKGTVVRIGRSHFVTTIMKTNCLGFYDILRMKMVCKTHHTERAKK